MQVPTPGAIRNQGPYQFVPTADFRIFLTQETNTMSHTTITANVGQNPISFETGKIAKLADGAVMVRSGDTVVLVSAVSATTIKEGQDSIIAMSYQPGYNLRYDYLQKKGLVLRKRG